MTAKHERPADFEKLPKRFKDYINSIEEQMRGLRAALPKAQQTRVRIVDHSATHGGRPEQHLPDRTEIAFNVARKPGERSGRGDEWIGVKYQPNYDGIEIHGETSSLAVLPSASNVVYVRFLRRSEE